jgi:4-hydroxy-4-methyl-2-oxoglutarate aldolase
MSAVGGLADHEGPAGLGGELPPTPALSDVLALRGGRGWLSPPLRRVTPAEPGVVGAARTVRLRPGPGGFGPLYELLSGDLRGQVLVVQAPTDEMAVWGGLLSTAAVQVGLTAVLVDGAVRDVGDCHDLAIPVWASTTCTVGPAGGLEVAELGVPLEIGDVVVEDGATVVVDDDGVVALPATDAEQLLLDAATYAVAEERVVAALRAGVPLREAYRLKATTVADLA